MQATQTERRYLYHAHALAIGGALTRPVERPINVAAASSLPADGGYQSSRVGKYRLEELISFEAAYTEVSGTQDPKDGSYTTLAVAVVEELNVLDVVTADRVVAQLATKHPATPGELRVVPLGSRFENLRIAGELVDVDLDVPLFTELDTYSALEARFAGDSEFRAQARDRFGWAYDENSNEPPRLPESEGVIGCTLMPGGDGRRRGHRFTVPQFGTVTLAELFVSRRSRRLTMLRLELGSPVEGRAAVGDVMGNGSTFP